MRPEDYWINLGENVIGLDAIADGEKARQYRTYIKIVELILENHIRSILDMGCNYGTLAYFLDLLGYSGGYYGIDSNPHAIAIAVHNRLMASIVNLRDLSGFAPFDWPCVVVKDVIEHLESIKPLREAFRISSRYVIIATYLPWHDAPSVIIQHPDGYYTNTYNRAEIAGLAKDCGFGLIEDVQVLESNGTPNEVTLWERE